MRMSLSFFFVFLALLNFCVMEAVRKTSPAVQVWYLIHS